ncbi:hypothetical protein BV22DRAFT_1132169 [Leucogyrophana mollusca]|uniref:Uncharacterized protein n=1 Tax=Leucogyrophana mollusca TaxID=85980 RepID=A0ACB8B7X3_9AGAM|nr:hypothetical protein BV22DRAFT_1132169 [Leucogyrophana mollusca]
MYNDWLFPEHDTYTSTYPQLQPSTPIEQTTQHGELHLSESLIAQHSVNGIHVGQHHLDGVHLPLQYTPSGHAEPHFHVDPDSGLRRSTRSPKKTPAAADASYTIPSHGSMPSIPQPQWSMPSHQPVASIQHSNPYPNAPFVPSQDVFSAHSNPKESTNSPTPILAPPTRGRGAVATKNAGGSEPRSGAKGIATKESTVKPKSVGKGSKSGEGNRQTSGNSDNEIAKLTEKQLAEADLKLENAGLGEVGVKAENPRGLSDDDKLTVVKHITSSDVWPDFKLHQQSVFTTIVCNKLDGCFTATQVRNYWLNQAWEKYKQVREREEHTGGGDGDDDRNCSPDADEEDNIALDGTKRKRGTKKLLIDAVAKNDDTVVRSHDINSSDSISDADETPSIKKRSRKAASFNNSSYVETTSLLHEMMENMSRRHKKQEHIDEANMLMSRSNAELARKRDRREQEEHDERRAAARRQEEQQQREARGQEWKRAMEMLDHHNPLIKQQGERLAQRLTREEQAAENF